MIKKIIKNNKKNADLKKNIILEKNTTKNKKKWSQDILNKKNHTKFINMLYLEKDFSEK